MDREIASVYFYQFINFTKVKYIFINSFIFLFVLSGKRFGVMQTKVGLITILNHYKVETCDKTDLSYVNDPTAFLLAPKNGIHLKFIKDISSI